VGTEYENLFAASPSSIIAFYLRLFENGGCATLRDFQDPSSLLIYIVS
jgi:hypothetical protein